MIDEAERPEASAAHEANRPRLAGDFNHVVQFYEDDALLCDTVARFIGAGLAAGENVVIIATELHRHAFRERLEANDFDVTRALASGRLTLVDASETLARIVVDGVPDPRCADDVLGAMLGGVAAALRPVRVYGEMVDLLWRDGQHAAALRLEEMWNELGRRYRFSLLCAYLMGSFYGQPDARDFGRVCRTHARVVPAERYSRLDDAQERLREMTRLQQRADVLEAEIDRRKAAEARLAGMVTVQSSRGDESEARFRLIVESVYDYAIFMLDAGGHVSSWNGGAERIKGWRADEIIGKHFSTFYPEEEVEAGRCELELRVAARDGRFEDEGWRVRKDGSRFWANVVISRVLDPATGALVGFAKVTRDLSQRRALELEKVRRAAAEAELAERKKSDSVRERLLGVVGHDLRAPLSAIAMAAGVMLKRGTLESNDMKMAARIARNADRMAKMISQLLDFTRARLGGGIPIDPKPMDLGEVCGELLGDSEIAHPDRSFTLDRHGDLHGVWDRERMAQVLANLVGNAAKYGKPGAPIAIRLDGDAADVVRLEVHNDGAPIAADVLPSIFDPFRRGDEHRERAESLGLGLYIVHEIVRVHGGTIAAASTAEEGTTFTVTLPRHAPAVRVDG